jgi:hypothetical protein
LKKQKIEDQFEKLIIELKDKMVVLNILPFDTDINVDDILKIDHSNWYGEILTFNVLFNRIANLKAEQENIVSVSKMDLEAFESQLYEEYKKKLSEGEGKVTEKSLEMSITRDARYISKKKLYFEKVKNLGYLESLYWSAQNKANLLRVLSDKMRPEEFSGELLQDTVNGVMIKVAKKLI